MRLFIGYRFLSGQYAVYEHDNSYINNRRNRPNEYCFILQDGFLQSSFTFCSLSAFRTTETELNAIAAPAIHGAKSPTAANGMPMLL